MKPNKTQKSWTVIILGNNRQVGSFEITKILLTRTILFLAGCVLLISVSSVLYVHSQSRVRQELQNKLAAMEIAQDRTAKKSSQVSQQMKDLEEALAAFTKESPFVDGDSLINTSDQFNKMSVENFDIILDKENDTVQFKFLLKNSTSYNVPVSGHVFVILRPDYLDSSSWQCYPKTLILNGMPPDFTKGESFTISRFKTIRGTFTNMTPYGSPYFVSIWVFSGEGKLLMLKDFFIRKDRGSTNES
jgi:hypothetical protein